MFELLTLLALTTPITAALGVSPQLEVRLSQSKPQSQPGSEVQSVTVGERVVSRILVNVGGCVITFPARPTKVILGRDGQFDVQYVEKDVAVLPLSPSASTNLFVYAGTRRYVFNLNAAASGGSRIILIRDPSSATVEVDVR